MKINNITKLWSSSEDVSNSTTKPRIRDNFPLQGIKDPRTILENSMIFADKSDFLKGYVIYFLKRIENKNYTQLDKDKKHLATMLYNELSPEMKENPQEAKNMFQEQYWELLRLFEKCDAYEQILPNNLTSNRKEGKIISRFNRHFFENGGVSVESIVLNKILGNSRR